MRRLEWVKTPYNWNADLNSKLKTTLLKAHAQVKAHRLVLYILKFFEAELSICYKGPLPTSCYM